MVSTQTILHDRVRGIDWSVLDKRGVERERETETERERDSVRERERGDKAKIVPRARKPEQSRKS